MVSSQRKQILQITTLALFIGLIVMMTFVPNLGYIQIGTLSITTLHIPVIIGSALMGPLGGLVLGATWGITSFIKVYTTVVNPIEFALFSNPFISIVPRILVGLIVAYGYTLLKGIQKPVIRHSLIALVGTLSNTILVLGAIGLFSNDILFPMNSTVSVIVITILSTNGLVEIISAMILVPAVLVRLSKRF